MSGESFYHYTKQTAPRSASGVIYVWCSGAIVGERVSWEKVDGRDSKMIQKKFFVAQMVNHKAPQCMCECKSFLTQVNINKVSPDSGTLCDVECVANMIHITLCVVVSST